MRERISLGPLEGFGPRDRKQLRREHLFPNRALALAMLEAARGLEAIHHAGLCHGHITRAGLRRGNGGQVCVTPLGDELAGSDRAPPMSMAICDDLVQRDLTDLGLAFAELVCNRPPVLGGKPGERAKRIRHINPGLSRTLADILERCIDPASPRRFASAGALVAELEKATEFILKPITLADRIGTHLYDAAFLAIPALLLFWIFYDLALMTWRTRHWIWSPNPSG